MCAAELCAADWVQIVRAEFVESPGLHVPKPQAQRLY